MKIKRNGEMGSEKVGKGHASGKGSSSGASPQGFTEEEKEAIKVYANEVRNASRRGKNKSREIGEKDLLQSIAKMPELDRSMAVRLHEIIKEHVPSLSPRTWYGMPAYAIDDKVVCFFQNSQKFKTRYSTLGFSDKAKLDQGSMWPTTYALTEMNRETEKMIIELLKKAVG